MNKTFKSLLALAIGAVAMTFASCSSEDDTVNVPSQQEIESKIIGKWKSIQLNGSPLSTNDRAVMTYGSDKNGTFSISRFNTELGIYSWENEKPVTWNVEGNTVIEKSLGIGMTRFVSVNEIDSNLYSFTIIKAINPQGAEHKPNLNMIAQKVTADFSNDIIGMWEGVEMTGYETYGNAEARIEYRADGTYTYYKKQGNYWVPSANVDNEYNVDGDWLATRWRPEVGADYNYEWWDIDYIKGDEMKWSALREKEDGTRFNTTFTWKKVELPTQKEIEEKIIGKWKTVGIDGEDCLTNTRMVFTYNADGTLYSSVSEFSEPLSQYIWDIRDQGTYSITDNVMTQSLTNKGITSLSNIYAISDIHFVEHNINISDGSQDVETNTMFIHKKVTADYSQDIIGMWEGVEMTGYETYGNAEARIEYRADGTYTYYKKENDEWVPSTNVGNEYNVDGDWLANRWRPEAGADYNYEWWDIDYIKDGMMKWSALREKEDGTRFTTTFTWKKVK